MSGLFARERADAGNRKQFLLPRSRSLLFRHGIVAYQQLAPDLCSARARDIKAFLCIVWPLLGLLQRETPRLPAVISLIRYSKIEGFRGLRPLSHCIFAAITAKTAAPIPHSITQRKSVYRMANIPPIPMGRHLKLIGAARPDRPSFHPTPRMDKGGSLWASNRK
jgi:hypothetical protein